ncbi:endo alpha-1,4 polygalactosaminidase [Castellaniella sp. FW104-16D08]|uniref:endo alpha-1,4 polygalactosaminidase n=1 Tax=unclassified Castellaniella TaxID=2617606 RepID=UPI00331582AA
MAEMASMCKNIQSFLRKATRGILWVPVVLCCGLGRAVASDISSIVFYYGSDTPVQALSRFAVAVLEPDAHPKGPPHQGTTRWLAYVSVGEVLDSRPYYSRMPQTWHLGKNDVWHSVVVDQSAPDWPKFLVNQVATPLWRQGYQGLFLDTLDSYQLVSKDPAVLERQRQGLVRTIRALRRARPKAILILNRGFELLPDIHNQIDAVAFESLYSGWDQAASRYVTVPEPDRAWLLGQAAKAKSYGLPVISIDYCPPNDKECTQQTSRKIRSHGLIPYVGDGHLQHVNLNMLP